MDFMKNKRTTKRDILIYIFICLILISIVYLVSITNILQPTQNATTTEIGTATLQIKSPNWNITYISNKTINTTVASLLFECAEKINFTIEKEYFSGYDSYYIDSINGIKNGIDNSYWQFYINGEFSSLGCDKVYINENDLILWVFEPSPW